LEAQRFWLFGLEAAVMVDVAVRVAVDGGRIAVDGA
jgi:hypothetical protein